MEAMVLILLTWLVIIPILAGIGSFLTRMSNLRLETVEAWCLAFWVGLALTITFLQIWHFAFPINDAARTIVGATGILGLALNRASIRHALGAARHASLVKLVGITILFLLFVIILANQSIREPDVYETGLYHLNVIQWSTAYPVVPGLANLHSRLGFSNAFFLYGTLLNTGPWVDRTFYVANGALYLVLMVQLVAGALKLRASAPLNAYALFHLIFIPVIWNLLFSLTVIPSVSNDPPLVAFGIISTLQIIALIENRDASSVSPFYRVLIVVLLAAVGTAVKFSFIVLGGGLVLLAVLIWLRQADTSPRQLVSSTLFLVLLVFIPMAVRSVIHTGYVAYPMTIGAFPVDWRVSEDYARIETQFIQGFARERFSSPAQVMADWRWLDGWIQQRLHPRALRETLYFSIPLTISILMLGFLAISRFLPLKRHPTHPYWWWLLAPPAAALAFWFWAAPDPRFVGATMWLLAATLVVIAVRQIGWGAHQWQIATMLVGGLAVMILPFLITAAMLWVQPDGDAGFHTFDKTPLEKFETRSGLSVWTPTTGNQCWDAPLPCTPYPHPDLRLRKPGDLSQGFINHYETDPAMRID